MSAAGPTLDRVLGRFGGTEPGPLLVTIGGLHGNEPSGVFASRRVLEKLQQRKPRFRGEYLALTGNIAALEKGQRYIDEDLNRIWLRDRLDRLAEGRPPATAEEAQLQDLLREIKTALARTRSDAYFLDLHSTSAAGSGFSVFADTLRNRHLASLLPCPMVLGLEEHLQGTMLNYINELGYAAVGFEGGQNDAPSSVDAHERGVWQTLAAVGCLDRSAIPELSSSPQGKGHATGEALPPVVEIRYRHEIREGESFVMRPGFENLDRIRKGDLLAQDKHGEIRSLETGFILMPLYQAQGSDGFFLVRSVNPFWLDVSERLRTLGLGNFLQYCPGVTKRRDGTLAVNSHIARWLVVEIFHLLGFRRQRPEGALQIFARRRETAK